MAYIDPSKFADLLRRERQPGGMLAHRGRPVLFCILPEEVPSEVERSGQWPTFKTGVFRVEGPSKQDHQRQKHHNRELRRARGEKGVKASYRQRQKAARARTREAVRAAR